MHRLQSGVLRSCGFVSSLLSPRSSSPFNLLVLRRGYATEDSFTSLLEEISASIPKTNKSLHTNEIRNGSENENGNRSYNGASRGGFGDRGFSKGGYGGKGSNGENGYGGNRGNYERERGYDTRGFNGDRGYDSRGYEVGDRGYGSNRGYGRSGFGGGSGGGFGGGSGGFGGPMKLDQKLESVDWSKAELAPVNKNIYKEQEAVSSRPLGEVQKWRSENGITIKGAGCPNPIINFEQTTFPKEIVNLLNKSFDSPTPIQAQGWPLALSGKDMVGSSQTGSGKTLGFVLPALVHITEQLKLQPHKWSDGPIALVLAPTRELALQIISESNSYIRKLGLKATAVYGGAPRGEQLGALRQGVHLLVATPGRLIDFLSDGTTNLRRVSYVVMDEADRMLDMGFEPQIRQIMAQLRPDRQTLMWSATWPAKVQSLAYEFFDNPITIHIGSTELRANPNVTQKIHITSERDKRLKTTELVKELHREGPAKTLIFCATRDSADHLSYILQSEGFHNTATIHGGKSQSSRMQMLGRFRDGHLDILVATDVAARGLDISNVQYVINFDFPNEIEDYIHRIGRTGRAGKTGTAHTFLSHEKHPGKLTSHLIKVLHDAGQEITQELRAFSGGGGGGDSFGRFGGYGGGGHRGRGRGGYARNRY